MVPLQPGPHWLSSRQGVRQTASTQLRPAGQWAFAVHWGTGRVSGLQIPTRQRSAGLLHMPGTALLAAQEV
jgi:hypothetical protein